MTDRVKFRSWYKGRFIYTGIQDTGYYTAHDNNSGSKYIGDKTELPYTLVWRQCTGLKDKKGKPIYEDDILRLDVGERFTTIVTGKVAWNKNRGYFCIIFMDDRIQRFAHKNIYECKNIELIGNIHEKGEYMYE